MFDDLTLDLMWSHTVVGIELPLVDISYTQHKKKVLLLI